MAELTLENLTIALRPLVADLSAVKADLSALKVDLSAVRADVSAMKGELSATKTDLTSVRIRVDGLPLIGAAIEALQRDSRLLRAAINDMSRTNITAGEVEAMHEDLDRVMARQAELERRLITLEQSAPKG